MITYLCNEAWIRLSNDTELQSAVTTWRLVSRAKAIAASREVRTGLTCQHAPPVDRKSTGIRCCRDRRPQQRVVVLTNTPNTSVRKWCKKLGADAVFDKSEELEAFYAFCAA